VKKVLFIAGIKKYFAKKCPESDTSNVYITDPKNGLLYIFYERR